MTAARTGYRARRHVRGFTLIELVVVVAIMAIMAAVAMPKFAKGLSKSRTKDEANRILSIVRYGQSMAALERTTYWLKMNLDAQTYTLERGAGRGDDFEMTGDDLSGGYGSGLPMQPPVSGDAASGEQTPRSRGSAGPVDVFDETCHTMPVGVVISKIVDMRGTETMDGEYSVPLDPRGVAQDVTIYIGARRSEDSALKAGVTYAVRVGANGLTEMNVERTGW